MKSKLQPIPIPAGTPVPFKQYLYTKTKFPKVKLYVVDEDGKETPCATIVPTFKKDEKGNVIYFTIDPDSTGGVSTENLILTVKP